MAEMESRVAVLEETVSMIRTAVELLRKLAEEPTSELSDIRQNVVKTEEFKQLMAVAKLMQIQGLDGEEESTDDKEEKGVAGLISSGPKEMDFSNKLEEPKDECLSQQKENDMLKNELKQLADQYALSEEQYAEKLKQKSSELQLADLKIKQLEEKLVEEQSQKEIYAEEVSQLTVNEKVLQLQVTTDREKFQQLEVALRRSTDIFETFESETKKLKNAIEELSDENQQLKNVLDTTTKQKEVLESVCRVFQAERKLSSSGNKKE